MGIICVSKYVIHGNCISVASGFVKWDVSQSIPYGLNSCGGLAITSLFCISRDSPITCVCEIALKVPSPPHSFSHTLPYSLTVRAAGWLGSYRSFSRGSISFLPACLPAYCGVLQFGYDEGSSLVATAWHECLTFLWMSLVLIRSRASFFRCFKLLVVIVASVQIDNNFMLEIVECDPFCVCVFLFSFEEIAVERKLPR